MNGHDYDVLIVGGGVAGLACASLLRNLLRGRREPLRIAVLEARAPRQPAADAGPGLRVFAIAPAGRAILEACGGWNGLPPGMAAPYERMRVWQAGSTPFGAGSGTAGEEGGEDPARLLGHGVGLKFRG